MFSKGSRIYLALGAISYLGALLFGVVSNAAAHGGVVAMLHGNGIVDGLLGPLTFGYKGGIGDHIGYGVLIALAAGFLLVGVALTAFRDADPQALAQLSGGEVPQIPAAPARSIWPFVMALGAAVGTAGLAVSWILEGLGVVLMLIGGIEWLVQNMADTTSSDPAINKAVRDGLMNPVEYPVGGLLLIVTVVFSMSRIFLTFDKTGTLITGLVLLVAVLVTALALNAAPHLKKTVLAGVVIVGFLIVIALGIIGAARGEHEVHEAQASTSQVWID